MQTKYCFKKEWMQFLRTKRFFGIILAMVLIAVIYPLLYAGVGMALDSADSSNLFGTAGASIETAAGAQDADASQNNTDLITKMFTDAGAMFAMTSSAIISSGGLVVMLLLMQTAGGEQKKRAMIVPLCSGLKNKSYLTAKFVIYPCVVFIISFVCIALSGALCGSLFSENRLEAENVMLAALLGGIYMVFITSVYLAAGLCSSRPGISAAVIFVGSTLAQSLFEAFGLSKYQPFALLSFVAGGVADRSLKLSDEAANYAVSAALALVISVIMFFLTLGVLNAKKINNQEEVKPEF